MPSVPSYLSGYEDLYATDPRQAAVQWFREARYGLFLHYGLYSLLGRHEWVQYREKIPVHEYQKLMDDFDAEGFDAKTGKSQFRFCTCYWFNFSEAWDLK